MKLEQNNQQFDWLDRAEELNDVEAAQVNGGMSASSAGSAGSIEARANALYKT